AEPAFAQIAHASLEAIEQRGLAAVRLALLDGSHISLDGNLRILDRFYFARFFPGIADNIGDESKTAARPGAVLPFRADGEARIDVRRLLPAARLHRRAVGNLFQRDREVASDLTFDISRFVTMPAYIPDEDTETVEIVCSAGHAAGGPE